MPNVGFTLVSSRRNALLSLFFAVLVWCTTIAVHAQNIGAVTRLAPFAGHLYTPAAGQSNIGFWGTDLGISFTHGNEIRFLFGDSWADPLGTPIGTGGDDSIGAVSATAFATGDQVDHYVATYGPGLFDLPWQSEAPPITFPVDNLGKIKRIEVLHNGTTQVGMELLKTPAAGFSNGGNGAFAIFSQAAPLECTGPSHTCPMGYSCDTGLGLCPYALVPDLGACVLGTTSCSCQPTAGGGLCQDRTSSWYDSVTDLGRTLAVPLKFEVGNADPSVKNKFYSQTWPTNKFINVAARTVQQFDKDHPLATHDYHVAGASGDQRQVFMWGRPHVYGIKALGHDAKLYFAVATMPEYNATGNFTWQPQYFKGMDVTGTIPLFSGNPADAKPLDLSGFPTSTTEQWDISLYMSISYVPTLNKWVMLYGGNESPVILAAGFGASALFIQPDPQGAIHARFATNPWGPWSAPKQVLAGGDPNVPPLLGSEYGPLGILHHDACIGIWCAPDEPAAAYLLTPWGWLYAPEIVDQWTTPRGNQADIYWTVSTWAPYETVLYKTRLLP